MLERAWLVGGKLDGCSDREAGGEIELTNPAAIAYAKPASTRLRSDSTGVWHGRPASLVSSWGKRGDLFQASSLERAFLHTQNEVFDVQVFVVAKKPCMS